MAYGFAERNARKKKKGVPERAETIVRWDARIKKIVLKSRAKHKTDFRQDLRLYGL